jgi:hypothetical protein
VTRKRRRFCSLHGDDAGSQRAQLQLFARIGFVQARFGDEPTANWVCGEAAL